MSKMMFEEFTKEVTGKIKEFLPERFSDAEVSLKVVTKNNDTKLTGLTIKAVNSNIAPTIYLEKFYEDYEHGEDFVRILRKIAETRIATDVEKDLDVEYLMSFETCKNRIVPRLISRDMNTELLAGRPHKVIEDLAVTYHVLVNNIEDATASVAVTNDIMSRWGVTVDELHEAAIANIPMLQRSTFQSMSEVLFESMGSEFLRDFDGDVGRAKEAFDEFFPTSNMYVLSTVHKLYGAAALLDKNMMANIYEKFDGKFNIIPSSTHELLIVGDEFDSESLRSMIQDVNRSTVEIESQLSNHPYRYDLERGLISV